MRYPPNQSNLRLTPAVLAQPASSPPWPSLHIRVSGLPWHCTVRPDPKLSPGNAFVTVQDVLVCLYFHLRMVAKADEYYGMGRVRRALIARAFERRVGNDPAQRGKGLRRIDFLSGQIIAQGLVHDQGDVWGVVVR
ncbi:hypothetical protein H4582DRAFT_1814149 [Lactarius indigo]|nr:hypothetical protein H4582DRAFT_1814149 [Lactarius indigo]